MKILLDTHIWLWWLNQDPQLSEPYHYVINTSEQVFVSIASCFELKQWQQQQKIDIQIPIEEWLSLALAQAGIINLPITEAIVEKAAEIKLYHEDMTDNFIIATALVNDCLLMSFNEDFLQIPRLEPRLIGKGFL